MVTIIRMILVGFARYCFSKPRPSKCFAVDRGGFWCFFPFFSAVVMMLGAEPPRKHNDPPTSEEMRCHGNYNHKWQLHSVRNLVVVDCQTSLQ